MKFIPIPEKVLTATSEEHHGLLLDLYRRSAKMQHEPFQVSYRQLAKKHGLNHATIKSVLEFLVVMDQLEMAPGEGRNPTVLRFPLEHTVDQPPEDIYGLFPAAPEHTLNIYIRDKDKNEGSRDQSNILTKDIGNGLDSPTEEDEIWSYWKDLELPDGTRPHSKARKLVAADRRTLSGALKDITKGEACLILRWAHTASESWYRDNGYLGLYTLLKPTGRNDRLDRAEKWLADGASTASADAWSSFEEAYRAKPSQWWTEAGGTDTPLYRAVGRLGGSTQLMEKWSRARSRQAKADFIATFNAAVQES